MWAPGRFISEVRDLGREFLERQSLSQTLPPSLPGRPVFTQHLSSWALREVSFSGAPQEQHVSVSVGDLKIEFERKSNWVSEGHSACTWACR